MYPLTDKMNKLGLSKKSNSSKLSASFSKSNDEKGFPSNQEELFKIDDEEDIDFSLDLTNCKEENVDYSDIISETLSNFNHKIDIRHQVAKAREGLSYAIKSDNYPPYLNINLKCTPGFHDDDTFNDFKEMWTTKSSTFKTELLNASINHLDTKIKELNNEINNIVETAKTKIGYATKGSADARKELNNRLKATKERYDSDLFEFKTNIRSRKQHKYPSQGKYRNDRYAPY